MTAGGLSKKGTLNKTNTKSHHHHHHHKHAAKNTSHDNSHGGKGRVMTQAEKNQMASETIAMFDRLLGFYSNLNQDSDFNERNSSYIDEVY